eukprot:1777219-Rhodomonas_salina.2
MGYAETYCIGLCRYRASHTDRIGRRQHQDSLCQCRTPLSTCVGRYPYISTGRRKGRGNRWGGSSTKVRVRQKATGEAEKSW